MNETMTQLYRRGLTVVSTRRGYGLYFTKGDTLQFLELQADNDHCADQLLQAAREKTGAANARILLAENQTLYLGSGRRCGYGGGFYDRYLAEHPHHATLALCYDFQMFAHLETDSYDVPVQYVLSAPVGEVAK